MWINNDQNTMTFKHYKIVIFALLTTVRIQNSQNRTQLNIIKQLEWHFDTGGEKEQPQYLSIL